MAASRRQDADFIGELIDDNLLEVAIDWIAANLSPEDVFGEAALADWATHNGFIKEEKP